MGSIKIAPKDPCWAAFSSLGNVVLIIKGHHGAVCWLHTVQCWLRPVPCPVLVTVSTRCLPRVCSTEDFLRVSQPWGAGCGRKELGAGGVPAGVPGRPSACGEVLPLLSRWVPSCSGVTLSREAASCMPGTERVSIEGARWP